jgi:hypothetical protein
MTFPMQQGVLPLEYLIAAPLEALVRAQALSARTTAEFVSDVGFETDEKGVSHARMVDFEYMTPRTNPDNPSESVDTPVRVRVPVLTLLQVPNVAVEEASVELSLRVATAPVQEVRPASLAARQSATAGSARLTAFPIELAPSPVRMIGTVTAPKLAEQTASLKVTIKLKQAPTPEGLTQILSLLGDATTARPAGEG